MNRSDTLILSFFCLFCALRVEAATGKPTQNTQSVTHVPTAEPNSTTVPVRDLFFRLLTSHSQPTTSPQPADPPRHKKLLEKCRKLPTHRLRLSCKSIAENTIVINMNDSVEAFVDLSDEKRFLQKPTSQRIFPLGRPPIPGEHQCDMKCPSGKEWHNAVEKNERSFSPWGFCRHFDPDRLPQWISYAKCKCKGCMDPNTSQENMSFISVGLKTAIPVLRKEQDISTFKQCNNKLCKESVVEITIGCHCILPKIEHRKP